MLTLIAIALFGVSGGGAAIRWRCKYTFENRLLSEPSRNLLRDYKALPVQYQNLLELERTLSVMDIKSKMSNNQLSLHFGGGDGKPLGFKYDNCTCSYGCKIPEYRRMAKKLGDIAEEVEAAKRIDRLNAIEPGSQSPDEVDEILSIEYAQAVMYTEAISPTTYKELV